MAELEEQGMSACLAHGMHLDPAVYGQLQSLRWLANPPPAVSDSVACDVAYGAPMPWQHMLHTECFPSASVVCWVKMHLRLWGSRFRVAECC